MQLGKFVFTRGVKILRPLHPLISLRENRKTYGQSVPDIKDICCFSLQLFFFSLSLATSCRTNKLQVSFSRVTFEVHTDTHGLLHTLFNVPVQF